MSDQIQRIRKKTNELNNKLWISCADFKEVVMLFSDEVERLKEDLDKTAKHCAFLNDELNNALGSSKMWQEEAVQLNKQKLILHQDKAKIIKELEDEKKELEVIDCMANGIDDILTAYNNGKALGEIYLINRLLLRFKEIT